MRSNDLKITAGHIVIDSVSIVDNGSIVVNNGVVVDVGPSNRLGDIKAKKIINIPDHTVHPGFVNAHCHLDLGYAKGRIKPGSDFTQWIKTLVDMRGKASVNQVKSGIESGIARMLQAGTTTVGDVTTCGHVAPALIRSGLRAVLFHEILGYDPSLADSRMADLAGRLSKAESNDKVTHAVSPHAVYSVSPELMRKSAVYAGKTGKKLAIHICETADETQFAQKGTGPFCDLLKSLGINKGGFPRLTPVNLAARTGVLDGALLIHMNHPSRGDLAQIVRRKSKVVFCPNSNRWFGRKVSHPLLKLIKLGVPVGLGTDSLASNTDLDMRLEMREALRAFPELGSTGVFQLATQGGAMALGMPGGLGTLKKGAVFDAVAVKVCLSRHTDPLLAIIEHRGHAAMGWVGGRKIYSGEAA